MTSQTATLEVAAFLESTHANLPNLRRDAAKHIAERFAACVYDDLGKAPRLLDGDDIHAILGHLLPSRFGKKDPLAKHALPVLRAYCNFLEERSIISQSYEIRQSLEDNNALFLRIVETGEIHTHGHSHTAGPATKPIVNKASKVGRNESCPCGSGKKFKQCCAKIGS